MATPIPSITIFVRHTADCEFRDDEKHRRCRCRKYLRWFHDGVQKKRSVKSRSWEAAEDARRELEEKFRAGSTPTEVVTDSRVTLSKAIDLYTTDRETGGLGSSALKKMKRELKRFKAFMELRSVFFPNELSLELLLEYRGTWKSLYPSTGTQNQVQARLRAFLRFCHDAGWMAKLPKLSPITVDEPPTLPLSATEYETLLAKIPSVFTDERKSHRTRALIQLMRYSGLAIRDAVTLPRSEMLHDKKKGFHRVKTARQKTGTHVSVLLPSHVADELLNVPNSNPRYFFWTGNGLESSAVTGWQHDLRTLFRATFGKDTEFTPHCLRDTFAVECLTAGIPLEEVSKLLGHQNTKTTEKSYLPWVQERQERLDAFVMRAALRLPLVGFQQ
jgi:integrase/recombinase XerD